MKKKPLILLVLDGLGVADPNAGNAVTLAKTPNLDNLWPRYPHTYLHASGNFVGLPMGVTGNSEVGHMSIGAGRIVFQEIAKIDHEIETGEFFSNNILNEALNHAKTYSSKVHFMGVVSDGNVHASLNHLFACLELCTRLGFNQSNVCIHGFSDGRDTAPQAAKKYFGMLEATMSSLKVGKLASIIGRYYSMDRDTRWERTQKAYELIVHGKGIEMPDYKAAIDHSYENNKWDEYLDAYTITENGKPVATVEENDVLIFFNYRGDRAVQLSKAFEDKAFNEFPTKRFSNLYFAGFSNYEKGIVMNRSKQDEEELGGESQMVKTLYSYELQNTKQFPIKQVFPPTRIYDSLGKIIADAGLSQLRIAESEKYPHVTYFFNSRLKDPFNREERLEIPSPKDVATYDLKPEMSNYEVTQTLIQKLREGLYDFILVNFALTDMVAHTGNLKASIKAVEVADECIGLILKELKRIGGDLIITADHGNIEELIDIATEQRDTKHSLNQVPFMYVSNRATNRELQLGMLADIAPTILTLLGISIPNSMNGRNLVV